MLRYPHSFYFILLQSITHQMLLDAPPPLCPITAMSFLICRRVSFRSSSQRSIPTLSAGLLAALSLNFCLVSFARPRPLCSKAFIFSVPKPLFSHRQFNLSSLLTSRCSIHSTGGLVLPELSLQAIGVLERYQLMYDPGSRLIDNKQQ